MSRIGLKVVKIPTGVTVTENGNEVTVKGPKGELTREFSSDIKMSVNGDEVKFSREDDSFKAVHGTTRSNFSNMVEGVTDGFKKNLTLVGVGYRAQMQGKKLVLNVGYSHPVEMEAPEGVSIEVPSTTSIVISGISKQVVGQFAAEIRSVRAPEPYKGKGIRYEDEVVRRKEGKTGK